MAKITEQINELKISIENIRDQMNKIKIENTDDITNDLRIISRMGISNPGIKYPIKSVIPAINSALRV